MRTNTPTTLARNGYCTRRRTPELGSCPICAREVRPPTFRREVTYTIVSVWNGNVLDIHNTGWQSTSQSSAGAIVRPFHPGIILYPWEFTLPSVHVPLGWLHIQNVATGHLLCQSRRGYGWADLVPAPDLLPEPQYRSTWQFQWTLCQSRWFDESTAREHNSWRIINRETRYPLCVFHNGTHPEWTLQLDTPRSWRIVSCASQGLVTDSQADGGLCCSPHVLPPSSGRQSWLLKTLGPSFANSPPRYEPVHHRTPPPEASLHLPASRKLTTNYSPCRKIAMQNSAVPTVRLSLMLRFTLGLMRGRGRFRT